MDTSKCCARLIRVEHVIEFMVKSFYKIFNTVATLNC